MTEHRNPADLPLGALLRDPVSGRWAVRFQVDDTTGKGMHAWLLPATESHPDVRVLHHVEVRGWEPIHAIADQVSRLTRELDEAREHLEKVRRGLRTPEGWATKIHAVYVRQQRDKARDLLGAIWLHVPWRNITRHLTTEQRELWADAVEVAGDPGSTIAADRWWRDAAMAPEPCTTTDDETCGDCFEGRCHWGSAGPAHGKKCGCSRHDASVLARPQSTTAAEVPSE